MAIIQLTCVNLVNAQSPVIPKGLLKPFPDITEPEVTWPGKGGLIHTEVAAK